MGRNMPTTLQTGSEVLEDDSGSTSDVWQAMMANDHKWMRAQAGENPAFTEAAWQHLSWAFSAREATAGAISTDLHR